MAQSPAPARASPENIGLFFGLLGVLGFSLSLPMTRLAVAGFDPTFVAFGRAVGAAVLSLIVLIVTKQPRPSLVHLLNLAVIGACIVIGFPLLSSWALRYVPAAHGSVVIGLSPIVTSIISVVRTRERPAPLFWAAALVGSAAVIAFAWVTGDGALHLADLLLLAAVLVVSFGYAEGAHLTRTLGSWQVICWALVTTAPFVLPFVIGIALRDGLGAAPSAWIGLIYLTVVSMFVAYFAWYRGLAQGGVARVSQVQLLQPILAIVWSALLLHEALTPMLVITALVVLGSIVISRKARVR